MLQLKLRLNCWFCCVYKMSVLEHEWIKVEQVSFIVYVLNFIGMRYLKPTDSLQCSYILTRTEHQVVKRLSKHSLKQRTIYSPIDDTVSSWYCMINIMIFHTVKPMSLVYTTVCWWRSTFNNLNNYLILTGVTTNANACCWQGIIMKYKFSTQKSHS